MIKLSDYIIRFLEPLGVRHMFMLPGGGAMHLNDSLGKSTKIQYVCCLHEQACAIAAEAYARVTGKPGLLMVTTGPGGTNALTGVAGAWLESTPMFVVSGQVKRADMINGQGIRQQGMQELDIVSVVKPLTKYAALVDEPGSIRYHLERALYEATHGRPGPVWLDIPLDVQAMQIDETALEGYVPPQPAANNDALEAQVRRVLEALNRAERPVLLAGNGIRLADGIDTFRALEQKLGIPVLTTWNGIDLVPEDDPLYFGRPGGLGHRYANFLQQNSDLFLSIGARLNLLQTGFNHENFARAAVRVMVDVDDAELHKCNVHPDIAICADAKRFMECLLSHADAIQAKPREKWLAYARALKKKYPVMQPEYWAQQDTVNTYALLDTLSEQMRPDDVYVSGSSGSSIDISMQTLRIKEGQRAFSTKGLASMGFDLPACIGACLAGGRRTICVTGDGGFQMNIQELQTLYRLQLPVKIFVLCNEGYGAIHGTQHNLFSDHFVACDASSQLTFPNFADVVAAYRVPCIVIRDNSELREKVAEALAASGPVICEVHTPLTLTASPKQVSYKRSDGQMESKPLEYLNPPLPQAEFEENMLIPLFEEQ